MLNSYSTYTNSQNSQNILIIKIIECQNSPSLFGMSFNVYGKFNCESKICQTNLYYNDIWIFFGVEIVWNFLKMACDTKTTTHFTDLLWSNCLLSN